MQTPTLEHVIVALGVDQGSRYVMTSGFEGERAGVLVRYVQACAHEPLLVSVAVTKGHSIEPLIRDSRSFALCRIEPTDRLLLRKFEEHVAPDERTDPFDAIAVSAMQTGSPVLDRAGACLDCQVVRHLDLEADHELYIGQVVSVRLPGSD